ncbi:MAG: hypothetical protein LBL66_03285 [Clostridiales bacterium]|jgi:spermidine/putrescine-binding protein|nr:hypothetical protein [Clostridiales bacterium]
MKLWRRIVVAAALVAVAALPLAACGSKLGAKPGEIAIMYFKGGFGDKWLLDATEKYRAAHPEVTFKLTEDPKLQENASLLLESGKNLPDIIMSQNFNWQSNVQFGQLASLDDLYDKPIQKTDGTSVKLKDYIVGDYKRYPWTDAIPGREETKSAWIVPWSANTVSFAYNDEYLKQTRKGGSEEFWSAPPETEAELKAFVADINAANAAGGYTKGAYGPAKTVKPFVWPGAALNWLTFVQTTWWAQYQGIGDDHPAEGNWYDFWDFESANVYKQSGLTESYRLLQDLFVQHTFDGEGKITGGNWVNLPDGASEMGSLDAEIEFIKGAAVMMPVGSWLERETEDYLDAAEAYPDMRANLRMMATPAISGARSVGVNNAQLGDFMCVPAKAVNLDLAKDFLYFLCQEEQLLDFTKSTGMMRPFEYDPIAAAPAHAWTAFQRDTIGLYTQHENFYEFSKKDSPIYVFKRLTPYVPTISTVIGNNLSKTPQEVVDAAFTSINNEWRNIQQELGLI